MPHVHCNPNSHASVNFDGTCLSQGREDEEHVENKNPK